MKDIGIITGMFEKDYKPVFVNYNKAVVAKSGEGMSYPIKPLAKSGKSVGFRIDGKLIKESRSSISFVNAVLSTK